MSSVKPLSNFEEKIYPQLIDFHPKCIIDRGKSTDEKIVLRLPLSDKDEVEILKKTLTNLMNVEWIIYITKPHFERLIYSKTWVCQHNKKNKDPNESKRNADCTAKLKIIIKKVTKNTKRTDKFLCCDPPLTAEVCMDLKHSHDTSSAETLRMLRVSEEVKEAYHEYFANGLGPAEAIRCHENKFLAEEDYIGLANASVNPTKRQVDYMHDVWRQSNLGSYANPLETLKLKLDIYKANGTVVKIYDERTWAVLLATPIMQRTQSLDCASEIVFIDSTCSCESTSSTLTTVLVATKAGAIPVAILIHDAQTAESYNNAFELLKTYFPKCFGGKIAPSILMTDDSSAEKTALRSVWPESVQLLCHFHVAQAEWRWIFSQSKTIPPHERPRLMRLFQAVMYAKSDPELTVAVTNILREKDQYPLFVKRFLNFYERREEWILFFRQHLITRSHNTNNYAEASIRILKDIILCRTKAFNVVALCEFCISVWENYLKKKLLDFAHCRRNANLIHLKFNKRVEKYSEDDLQMLSPDTYRITSSTNSSVTYDIYCDIGACSCESGKSGAFCKHQFFLMEKKKIYFPNAPAMLPEDRYKLAVLALGHKCPPTNFFAKFKDQEVDVEETFEEGNLSIEEPELISSPPPVQKLASSTEKNEINLELNRLIDIVGKSSFSEESGKKILTTLRKIKTVEDMKSLILLKNVQIKRGSIGVQPTSIARRRFGLVKSKKRVPSGRPPQKNLASKRGLKRKRNLNENIKQNQPNAKSHGPGH